MSLKSKLILRCAASLLVFAALFFLPAGTLNFWEAWVFLGMFFFMTVAFSLYFFKYDPAVVKRRLEAREKERQQKMVMAFVTVIFIIGILIPGLDHRFGWTRRWTGGVPFWLEIVAQLLAFAGYLMTIYVIKVNRFAARTIRVEQDQKVISTGPYRFVRHPMYFAMLVLWLAAAPALGSYVALPILALLIPAFVWRLLNEEKVLRKELPGYEEYCEQTRYRLIPNVW